MYIPKQFGVYMFCRFCGAAIDKTDNFCINCGKRIERSINQFNRPSHNFDQMQLDEHKPKLDTSSQNAVKLSLILAIIALILAFFQSYASIILGVISFILANKEQQKSAIILSVIAIVIALINIFDGFYFLSFWRRVFYDF
jgi:hypothetical protein